MSVTQTTPLRWIGSVYYMQGLPFAVIALLSTVFYKNLQLSNEKIAFYTSLLILPWSFKPLWAPLLESLTTKRNVTLLCQAILVVLFFCIAMSLFSSFYFKLSLLLFFIIAFISATHDIVSDGVYLISLSNRQQVLYTGA